MASFATATANAYKPLQRISKETPVEEIANKIYDFWKSNTFIIFVKNIVYTMRPILLDARGYPNEKYKDFLSYFAFNYEKYPKAFITILFFSALEQNAITGVIRIVANDHDLELVQPKSKEKVFKDFELLTRLKNLNTIIPLILSDGKRVEGTYAKNAVISNTIIVSLSDKRHDDKRHDDKRHDDKRHDDKRQDDKRHDDKRHDDKRKRNNNNNNKNKPQRQKIGQDGGTRKRHRKSKAKATRKLHRN